MSDDGLSKDKSILAELARRVSDIAAHEANELRRDRWRRHNEFEDVGIPIYIRAIAERETIEPLCECEDPFYRGCERFLRKMVFLADIPDDYVIEPWISVDAVRKLPPEGAWGVPIGHAEDDRVSGAFTIAAPIKTLGDRDRLVTPRHEIDEAATEERVSKLYDAIGDSLEINVSRKPFWSDWNADLSTNLGYLRGIEQMLWDMADSPEWLKGLLGFMRDGVLKAQEEAEAAGDWCLGDHQNQSMPYAASLSDPKANSEPVKRNELWGFFASQETGAVSPEMFDEFMVSFQKPIAEEYAIISYGCCEDLSRKIHVLRKINNLRRIAVSPFADVKLCAEQIGTDYICSWRPSPADMVAYGYDADRVRSTVGSAKDLFEANGCRYDVCLKDVETVQNDPTRIGKFIATVREVTETESYPIGASGRD